MSTEDTALRERVAKLEAELKVTTEMLKENIEELKQSNTRVEHKLDQTLEKLNALHGKMVGISFVVGAIVTGVFNLVFSLFRKQGGG